MNNETGFWWRAACCASAKAYITSINIGEYLAMAAS
jgi:hypothetical protein